MGLPSASGSLPEKRGSGVIGSSAPGMHFSLSRAPCLPVFPRSSFCPARPGQSSPPAVWLPFRAFSRRSRPHLAVRAPPLAFPCRSAHSFQRSPHSPEVSTPRVTVRVQGFSPSSRFTPPPASRVYFTPLTPFDFSLQGFPLPRSCANSSLALAVVSFLRGCAPIA